MKTMLAAVLVASACASIAQAQQGQAAQATAPSETPTAAQPLPGFSLDQAVSAAGGSAPSGAAANASVEAAQAARAVAGLRPNPVFQGQIENVVGSGPYKGMRSAATTVGIAIPIELAASAARGSGSPTRRYRACSSRARSSRPMSACRSRNSTSRRSRPNAGW